MFLSILIMVMGFSVKGSIDYYVAETDRDLQFEYLYLLKYPLDYVPENAEEAYTESLRTEYAATGGTTAVTLQGIKRGSDYFGFEPASDQNSVIISNSAASTLFIDQMAGTILLLIVLAIMVMIITVFLLINIMIEKSRYSISLTKALGYGRRSIERVFLRPGTVTVMTASAISVPLCKYIMNYLFPYLVTNFPSGMEVVISAKMYAEIFALIVGTYIVISFILKYQLSRVPLTEILKNVE